MEVNALGGLFDSLASYFPTKLFTGEYLNEIQKNDDPYEHTPTRPRESWYPETIEPPPPEEEAESDGKSKAVARQEEALLALLPLMNRRENAADINWSRNLPISMWTHIVLDDETGLVKHLLLNEVGLQADLGIELEPLLTPSLQIMQLIGNDVKGDIVWLGRAPNLQEVWLYMTSVTGDIKVFSKCRQIRIVGLYRTFAHGSIEIFRTTPKLEMLVAAESNIWGDISVFTHTPHLSKLNLLKLAGVSGDVGEVFGGGKFPQLRALGLSDTYSVKGDIGAFRDTPHLEDLRLWNTAIVGDVSVFANLQELQGLNLHKTGVTGDGMVFATCCPALRELHLWKTATYGDAPGLRDARIADMKGTVYVDWDA